MLLSISCDIAKNDSIGDGYVAPGQLNLRRELTGKTGNVATLKHGDHVSILDVRRRFVKVRSASGFEGWVDAAQLLNSDGMAALVAESQRDLKLPSQGAASVFEPLNMHIEPNRQSPSLARIVEGEYVAVLQHHLTPKNAPPPPIPVLIHERPQPARKKREKATRALRLPAPPKPPKAPENWQQLSAERVGKSQSIADLKAQKDADAAARKAEEARKPAALEDWTLVRTKADKNAQAQTGWVLSRNLVMSIPDDVAQYAEGKRITSYFDLGTVNDEEAGVRHNWLWTTTSGQFAFDFDAWRVFLWNRHRHRYETSFRQRDVEGYYPVNVDAPGGNGFGRTFHMVTKDDDGRMRERTYFFDGVRVHLTGTEAYQPGKAAQAESDAANAAEEKKRGWLGRQWEALRKKFGAAPKQ